MQASEHAFSRSTESLWLALEKSKSNIKLVTNIPFFVFPALTDLSGRILQSALLLSQLVVFQSEIAFTSHMTSDRLASSPSGDAARLRSHRISTSSSIHSKKKEKLVYFRVDPTFASPSGSQSNRVFGPKTILIASLTSLK
ncbi:hypothetical protein TIFTF001_034171 [Ficus carica]|uniref:Uncharacterized protein n=1 Tax=Ficus carica TaxID=3494 RepID=A0AA88J859_FICCA|nr:hypothetical protein TIFTF001_034171 [Ficus carica]